MMSHTYHEGLPGFDARQIWHDGCHECEHRGKDLQIGLAHLDNQTFARAWRRAFDLKASKGGGYDVTGPPSHCEMGLLNVLWGIQVSLERFGQPLNGEVPNGH
jgi:hypothetical protein